MGSFSALSPRPALPQMLSLQGQWSPTLCSRDTKAQQAHVTGAGCRARLGLLAPVAWPGCPWLDSGNWTLGLWQHQGHEPHPSPIACCSPPGGRPGLPLLPPGFPGISRLGGLRGRGSSLGGLWGHWRRSWLLQGLLSVERGELRVRLGRIQLPSQLLHPGALKHGGDL